MIHPHDRLFEALTRSCILLRETSVGIQDHAVAGIQGHAVADALLYIVRASPSFLPFPINQSINQPFLSYLSSGYEPGSQGIFIEEAFYCLVYFYDCLPRTAFKFAARRLSLAERQNATWPCYEYKRSINQMLLDTIQ